MPKKQVRWSKSLLRSLGGVEDGPPEAPIFDLIMDTIPDVIPNITTKKLSKVLQKMKDEDPEKYERMELLNLKLKQNLPKGLTEEEKAEIKDLDKKLKIKQEQEQKIISTQPSPSITSQLSLPPSISSYMQPANTTSFIEYEIGPRKYELEKWKVLHREEAKNKKSLGKGIYDGDAYDIETFKDLDKYDLSSKEREQMIKEIREINPTFGAGIRYRKNKYMP